MARKAIYKEITDWLRAEANRRGPEALMPTIAEVCEKFGVKGVQTVRDGYEPLLEEGLVIRLGKPRRWAVADHGQKRAKAAAHGLILDEIEQSLARVHELLSELRLTQYA